MSLSTRLLPLRLQFSGSPTTPPVADGQTIVVERMRRRDLRAVLAIEHQVYPRPLTPTTFQTELNEMKAGNRDYIVAKQNGTVLGYGGIMLVLDEAHISNVAVDPRIQHRGLGRRLMIELCSLARAHGVVAMSLEVRVSNVKAQALYAEFGFASEGVRRKYYENTEDAIIMWRRHTDSVEFGTWLHGRMAEWSGLSSERPPTEAGA